MKKVRVFIERGKDGSYGAYMPDDNNLAYGLIGEGESAELAIADFRAVYEATREEFRKKGLAFEELEFYFSYDIPSFLVYYADMISYKGLSRLTGISQSQLSQYVSGYRTPSSKTTRIIEHALNTFGSELSNLRFI